MALTRIMIVDDEPHIVEMLTLRLEANDFEIVPAQSGPEALGLLAADGEVDVVMSDIMMPDMDGIEFMRRARAVHPDTEFVIMTGFASLDTAIEAVRLGAFDYIKKPFEDMPALIHTLTAAAEKKRLVLENRQLTEELTRANEKLTKVNLMLGDNVNELVMLHHIVESISGTISLDDVIDRFLGNLVSSLDFGRALLFLVNDAQGIIELKSSAGLDRERLGSVIIPLAEKGRDIIRALGLPDPIYLSGFKKDAGDDLVMKVVDDATRSLIYYPLKIRDACIGILMLESRNEIRIMKMHTLQLYIHQATFIIENARMFNRLVQINEELKKMDELKTEFISTVSHELRTPLTSVREGVSLVLEEIVGQINDKQERVLEMTRADVDRLSRLIEDLLNISRIESGKIILKRVQASAAALIERSVISLRAAVSEKRIRISTSCAQTMPEVYVDEDRIIQIVVNLLSNAIKFSPEGGGIRIDVKPADGGRLVEVAVADEGIGIDAKDVEKLFKRFSQIDRTDGPGYKGTGLGLAISKALAEMHGGTLWLKASAPGKGSTFAFTLPVYEKGIEERVMLEDHIEAAVRKMSRVNGDFSIVVIKGDRKINEDERAALAEVLEKGMPSDGDVFGLYSDDVLLVLLKGAAKSSALAWKENVLGDLPREKLKGVVMKIISYPEDGSSRAELLGNI